MKGLNALCTSDERHSEYEGLLRRALEDCGGTLGPQHRVTIGITKSLGSLRACQGDYKEAKQLLFCALQSHRTSRHHDQDSIFEILQELGTLYTSHEQHLKDEDLDQALQRYRDQELKLKLKYPAMLGTARSFSSYACLEQCEKTQQCLSQALECFKGKPEYLDMLGLMKEFGTFFLSQGRHNEAGKLLDQTWRGCGLELGWEYSSMLDLAKALASLYMTQRRYNEALCHFVTLKNGYEKTLGPEDSKTLGITKDIGASYAALGRHDDALTLLLPVHKNQEPGSKLFLQTVKVLGDVYTSQERYDEAEDSLLQSKQGSGSDIAFEIDAIKSLVRLYIRQQNFEKAWGLVAQAEETCKGCEKWGELHREIIEMSGDIHMEQGQYDDAMEKYVALRYVYANLLEKNDIRMPEILYRVAVVLTQQKQYAEAEKVCREVRDLCEKTMAWTKPLEVATWILLGDIAFGKGDVYVSSKMHSEARKVCRETFGRDHIFTHRISVKHPNNLQEQALQISLWLAHL
ncbi:hypothetical protein EDB81DRAFT_806602, partial [Dactylonectria macrodidyma]